ncbi:hypothetical protein [Diaphorobacter sp.]|nr:hypothetical protein [Diaphorobacter sp.]
MRKIKDLRLIAEQVNVSLGAGYAKSMPRILRIGASKPLATA